MATFHQQSHIHLCGCGTRWACSSCPCSNPAAPAWRRGCRARTAASGASTAPASPASAPEASSQRASDRLPRRFLHSTVERQKDERVPGGDLATAARGGGGWRKGSEAAAQWASIARGSRAAQAQKAFPAVKLSRAERAAANTLPSSCCACTLRSEQSFIASQGLEHFVERLARDVDVPPPHGCSLERWLEQLADIEGGGLDASARATSRPS